MDYSEIETTEQLLNAFKQCQNAGEEIQLFESLAERANPPVDAFVEILRKIKLETVLALAIQAFGKITDDDVKARLKDSDDLLVMLCEQAKSNPTSKPPSKSVSVACSGAVSVRCSIPNAAARQLPIY